MSTEPEAPSAEMRKAIKVCDEMVRLAADCGLSAMILAAMVYGFWRGIVRGAKTPKDVYFASTKSEAAMKELFPLEMERREQEKTA